MSHTAARSRHGRDQQGSQSSLFLPQLGQICNQMDFSSHLMNLDLICLHIALGLHPIIQVHEASNVLPRFSFQGRTQIFSKKANLDFPSAEQLNQTAPLY